MSGNFICYYCKHFIKNINDRYIAYKKEDFILCNNCYEHLVCNTCGKEIVENEELKYLIDNHNCLQNCLLCMSKKIPDDIRRHPMYIKLKKQNTNLQKQLNELLLWKNNHIC